MTIGIVKCIVFVIAVSILYGVIGHLNHKKMLSAAKFKVIRSLLSRFRPL